MELGVRGTVSEDQRDDLRRIKRNQRHLLSLVNDILNFARLETGRVDIAMEDVPVDDVLSRGGVARVAAAALATVCGSNRGRPIRDWSCERTRTSCSRFS